MSYGPRLLVSRVAQATNKTVVLEDEVSSYPSSAVWESANFFVVTDNEITGDFDFDVQWRAGEGSDVVTIASVNNVTTDTITQLALDAQFTGVNEAIPMPTHFLVTRNAGTFDYALWVMFA